MVLSIPMTSILRAIITGLIREFLNARYDGEHHIEVFSVEG